ncbi:MAG: hypothetical protein Q9199_004528 [Rusavskia elegans]
MLEAVGLAQLVDFTAKTIKYLNSIKDASKERAGLLREASNLLNLLISLQTQVDEAKQSEEWFVGIRSLTVKNGPLDQLRDGLEHLTDKLKPKRGVESTVRKFVWTLDKTYCEDMLRKIERAKSSITLALHGDTFKLAQAIKADTAGISNIDERVTAVSQSLERLHTEDDVNKRQEILAWFSPLNFFKTQQDMFARREDGTGNWLIESPTFQDWLSGSHRAICCTGMPGAGKSILASVVVDFLRKHRTKTGSTGVAAIYCNFKERQSQTPENLLAAACVQLANCRLKTRPTCTEVLRVLKDTVRSFDTVYLAIDALDECLEHVRDKFLIQVDALPGNTRRFLAAKLHVDALSSKGNVKTLKKALENLPTTLDELYDDAVQRIKTQSPDDEHLALKALRWVAYTYRPLGFRALQEALAIEPGEDDFDSDGMHPIGLILDVCAGLLIADEENEIVRLVHYTTQDYLDKLLASEFQDAHALIAGDGLTYLSYKVFQTEGPGRRSHWDFHLWRYASTFWVAHAMARRTPGLSARINEYLASNPRVELINAANYDHILPNEKIYSDMSKIGAQTLLPKYDGYGIAAFYGLCDELKISLQQIVNIDQLFHEKVHAWHPIVRNSALHLAVRNDQIETMCILLNHGADIEKKNSAGQTPLLLAIERKALTMAKELISRGANVMGEGSDLQIPFQKVWWGSPVPFLQYLLTAGTLLERRHLFDTSQLMIRIVDDNDLQTGQWLFESALQVPDMTSISSTLLIDAASHGALYFVNKLLDCGADVDSKYQDGRTALHRACTMGRLAVVKRLLERGIDVNIRTDSGQIALHRAAQNGDEELVKALITYNSDINVQDNNGSTPLIYAIDLDKTCMALQLLQHGANVNVEDDNGMTALHFASARGNLRIVQKLMEQQMSVEYKSLFTLAAKFIKPVFGEAVRLPALEGVLNIITCHGVRIVVFAIPKANDHEGLDILKCYLLNRDTFSEWRVWKQGMTALDIAVLHENKQIISLLASGNESKGQPDAISLDEYLCEFFGLSTIDEVIRTLGIEEARIW